MAAAERGTAMTTQSTKLWIAFKAVISGASFTITVMAGSGLIGTLSGFYPEVPYPEAQRLVSSLMSCYESTWQWSTGLLFVGFTWLAIQTEESAKDLVYRAAVSFLTAGAAIAAARYAVIDGGIHPMPTSWKEHPGDFFWPAFSSLPLLIAFLSHWKRSRNV